MKKTVLFLAPFVFMVIGVLASTEAHADSSDQQFVIDATNAGFTINDMSGLITSAKLGCIQAISMHDSHQIANIIWLGSPHMSTLAVAELAMIAAKNFCPIVDTYNTPGGLPLTGTPPPSNDGILHDTNV